MKSEQEILLELIKEVGVARLGNWDGCTCCRFSVRNVDIETSCGKGGGRGIWISSRSLDYGVSHQEQEKLLMPAALEVKRQIEAGDNRGPIEIHFHEWRNSHAQTPAAKEVRL